ncbi:MAG: terminase small subunit [Verrucomicrobiales bacterium]|nr:terminase small subunit [Verrucomicrobiales bacterium]
MPQLKSPRDEIFCQQIALGRTDSDAYRIAGGKAKQPNRRTTALRAKPGIEERIAELRAGTQAEFEVTREDLINFYGRVLMTPVGEVNEDSRLAQEVSTTYAGESYTKKVKMVSKIDAARELTKLMGWYEPEKVEVSGTLQGLLGRLMGVRK